MLQIKHISKTFPGVKALTDVSFEVKSGEVHAICGENGAGKSTLMNILSGNLQPDEGGEIRLHGQSQSIKDYNAARQLGIAIVYQERSLVDSLPISENIFANRFPKNSWGLIDYQKLNAQTKEILQLLDFDYLSPNTLVSDLSPAEKQMVEIGKALSQKPDILILDEPTASITEKESKTLFKIIESLKNQGVAIIYISHRLSEIFEIADTVTVLKDGKHQITSPITEITIGTLIKKMVGRDLQQADHQNVTQEEVLLEVNSLSGSRFNDCSFTLRKGEILALAGLVGAGRSEVARAIFGIDPKTSGTVKLNGENLTINHPADAVAKGIVYLPEERKTQGLFLDMNVQENILASVFGKNDSLNENQHKETALKYKEQLRIQTASLENPIRLLSGGNQQKCILARWLNMNPSVLMIDEPTHGVDVGAKFEIYQLLRQLAAQGTAIVLISSELPEVLTLADRILVMAEGRISGQLNRDEATEEHIMALASKEKTIK
jgi:ribose transport system ATP-binding protein